MMPRRCWGKVPLVGLLSYLLLAATAGCTSQPSARPEIRVDHLVALNDQPITITISHLRPAEVITLAATTTDNAGAEWRSSAGFAADTHGVVDVATAQPRSAPQSYRSPAAMGLFWSLAPLAGRLRPYVPPTGGEVVTLTASSRERPSVSVRVLRKAAIEGVAEREMTLAANGFAGHYWADARAASRHPAILLIGGSDGGFPEGGSLLASHGYPALELAYFKAPGLPQELAGIPLEYFETALRWLAAQPGADPSKVIVYGYSRGSEAAQLLAVRNPGLVHGVVALVPSNVSLCSFPGCQREAWSSGGQPVPFTFEFDQPAPVNEASVIPVEQIHGPVFLACGGADHIWNSCAYSNAIMHRLDSHQFAYVHDLETFPHAGHGIGFPFPYQPDITTGSRFAGDSAEGNATTDAVLWARILSFIDGI